MNYSFGSSRLKIEWAEKHINDLQSVFNSFIDTEYYSIVVDKNADTGNNALKFINTKHIPTQIPFIIGDAIHNTRTALDLIISQIEFEKTGINTRWSKFPFSDTAVNLVATVRGGKIQELSPVLADFIINVVKPYRTGNDALCSLHDLDIIDKHKLIIPTVAITSVRVNAEDNKGMIYRDRIIAKIGYNLDVSLGPHTVMSTHNLQINNYVKDTFDIFFDKGLPMERKPVIPTLYDFIEMVTGIIESVELLNI